MDFPTQERWHLVAMTGVRLGGIDPSILRELSGVYKLFAKALKELVSNAFDADADHVHISIADDCSSVIDRILIPSPFRLQFVSQIFPVERYIHPFSVGHVEITVRAFHWTKPTATDAFMNPFMTVPFGFRTIGLVHSPQVAPAPSKNGLMKFGLPLPPRRVR